jgi:hypothetical protein
VHPPHTTCVLTQFSKAKEPASVQEVVHHFARNHERRMAEQVRHQQAWPCVHMACMQQQHPAMMD